MHIPNLRCENGEAEAHTRICLVPLGVQYPARLRHSVLCRRARATLLGRDPKDMLIALIGPPRIVHPRLSPEFTDFWNYGDPFETYPIDTARLERVVELVAEKAEWGSKLPPRHGLRASPCIAAS